MMKKTVLTNGLGTVEADESSNVIVAVQNDDVNNWQVVLNGKGRKLQEMLFNVLENLIENENKHVQAATIMAGLCVMRKHGALSKELDFKVVVDGTESSLNEFMAKVDEDDEKE